ncbi:hypothetical protein CDD83_8323 [Cordyceps sp. RAO-2017]|nr:hypothetical protein CDD83_8323 [Cordyceps sp. RAO-2017]
MERGGASSSRRAALHRLDPCTRHACRGSGIVIIVILEPRTRPPLTPARRTPHAARRSTATLGHGRPAGTWPASCRAPGLEPASMRPRPKDIPTGARTAAQQLRGPAADDDDAD